MDDLIAYMVGERLDEMQDRNPKPCLSASARIGQFLVSRTKDAFTLSFGVRQENIKGSFDAAIGTIEQIRQHGFTPSELERAKASVGKLLTDSSMNAMIVVIPITFDVHNTTSSMLNPLLPRLITSNLTSSSHVK